MASKNKHHAISAQLISTRVFTAKKVCRIELAIEASFPICFLISDLKFYRGVNGAQRASPDSTDLLDKVRVSMSADSKNRQRGMNKLDKIPGGCTANHVVCSVGVRIFRRHLSLE